MSVEKGVKREAVVSYTVAKWEKLKRDRTGKEGTWNECIDAVMGNIQADSDVMEFRSQRKVPMAWQAVTNVESLIGVGLFPNDRFCMAVGENPDAEASADKRTRYMQNRLERMRYVEKYTGGHLKQLLTIGNSGRLLRWTRRQSRRKVDSYEFMGSAYRKSAYDFDGPDFDVLDMFNFVFDPTATDMERTVKIYRVKVSPAELLADADEGLYDKKAVKAALEGSAPHEPSDSDAQARMDTFGVSGTNKKADGDDEVELLWCHGDCPVGGKKHEVWRDYIWVIANRNQLIRFEENPLDCGLSPLRHTALVPVIGSSIGVGIIEPVLGLIDLIDVGTNQAIDAGAINLNGMWAYKEGAVNPDDLISKPGGAVACEDPNTDIKPLVPSMDFLQLYQTVEIHKREFVDSTFSWKNAGAQDDQTATAAAISANLQGSVIRRLASRLENIDIEPDLKLFDEMEQQFYEPNAEPPLPATSRTACSSTSRSRLRSSTKTTLGSAAALARSRCGSYSSRTTSSGALP